MIHDKIKYLFDFVYVYSVLSNAHLICLILRRSHARPRNRELACYAPYALPYRVRTVLSNWLLRPLFSDEPAAFAYISLLCHR